MQFTETPMLIEQLRHRNLPGWSDLVDPVDCVAITVNPVTKVHIDASLLDTTNIHISAIVDMLLAWP
ncbi:MAG: hypothetical protein U9R40_04010, partial [Synergistota bacterium]|nr:hypothetical protein [Synergistota bacterium]